MAVCGALFLFLMWLPTKFDPWDRFIRRGLCKKEGHQQEIYPFGLEPDWSIGPCRVCRTMIEWGKGGVFVKELPTKHR